MLCKIGLSLLPVFAIFIRIWQTNIPMNIHWKDWCWSWNSNTLAIWCEELTYLKWPWCWERLKAGGEGDDRGWIGWMASPTQWTWVWVNSGCWHGQGGLACSGPLGCKVLDRTERLNWTELRSHYRNNNWKAWSEIRQQQGNQRKVTSRKVEILSAGS